MKKLSNLLLLGIIVSGLAVTSGSAPVTAAGPPFEAGRIIDDAVFTNKGAMSVAAIQAFLNSKVPVCDTNHAPGPNSHGKLPPWTCLKDYYENTTTGANNLDGAPVPAGAISAAQIIWNNADLYNLNPQVLLVTLQKENGLITDTWPYPWQYRTAMGFACPDTAPCDPAFYGFAKQVYQGARHLRNFYDENPAWTVPYKVGVRFIQYNPNAACSGTNVNITTHGTAALYSYTPYQPNAASLAAGYGTGDACSAYGNRNFFNYFNDWFGSTLFPQPIGASLYSDSTGRLYIVTAGTKYYIPSYDLMVNYGIDTFPFFSVPDTTMAQFADGGILTNLTSDSGGVYLVNNRRRHHVPSAQCTTWSFACADVNAVKALGSDFQTLFLNQGGDLTQLITVGGVNYQIGNGQKSPIADAQSLIDLGLSNTGILVASKYNSSQPLGPLLITTKGVIKFGANPTIYYYDGKAYSTVGNTDTFDDWKLGAVPALRVPESAYTGTSVPPSTPLTTFYKAPDATQYVIDQGRRVQIPTALLGAWAATTFTTAPAELVAALTPTELQANVYANPNVYVLAADKLHRVPTYSDYTGLGITAGTTTVLRPTKVAGIAVGADIFAEGKVVGVAGDPGIYVVNQRKLLHIPDGSTFGAYGYSFDNIPSYPSSITTDYPLAGSDLGLGTTPDGSYFIPYTGNLFTLSAANATDFGAVTSNFSPIARLVVKNPAPKPLSRFLYNSDNGKIYYASGGAIHYVANYSSYVAYGGTRTPASSVNTAIIKLFLEAQPI